MASAYGSGRVGVTVKLQNTRVPALAVMLNHLHSFEAKHVIALFGH